MGFSLAAGFWSIWNWQTTGSFVFSAYLDSPPPDSVLAQSESHWISGIPFVLGTLVTTSGYWTDSVGPFLIVVLFGVALFRAPRESRLPALLVMWSILFYLFILTVRLRTYLFVDAHARYLGPTLLGFGALAAGPFIVWAQSGEAWLRRALMLALVLPALPLIALKTAKTAVALPAALGIESRSQYLTKKIETYPACEVLNALPDNQVLVLFMAQRPYYLDRRIVTEQVWNGTRNVDDLVRNARARGVTHVLFEPETVPLPWLKDSSLALKTPALREIGSWAWKQRDWVRLYKLERP